MPQIRWREASGKIPIRSPRSGSQRRHTIIEQCTLERESVGAA